MQRAAGLSTQDKFARMLGVIVAAIIAATIAPAARADLEGVTAPATRHPVLVVSIDGLRPEDLIDAERRGLKLPHLRQLLAQGAHASGVVGVLPTLTYPSHTTLMTGAAPARHGIFNNNTFDPTAINQDGWYWYASDIRVPTLWDAARTAGLSTGNVHWPVSVGAGIGWNLPQIWRTGHADDDKLLAALATPGLLNELTADDGAYAPGIAEDIDADEIRGRFAARLILRHHPDFLTVYLTALDHTQHIDGPGSAAAFVVLERIDAVIGKLIAAERAAHPDAVIALVSDHGFANVDTAFNLSRALIDAGLIRLAPPDPLGRVKIASWDAAAWASGGSIAVMLARPDDAELRTKVRKLLQMLQADPANAIARVLEPEAIARAGANPQAAFYVALTGSTMAVPYLNSTAPLRFPAPSKGMHGFLPEDPRMRSTFVIAGPGIQAGLDLGVIDMRAIAPTLARELGVTLAGTERGPVQLKSDRYR